jgi:hypothetical protein
VRWLAVLLCLAGQHARAAEPAATAEAGGLPTISEVLQARDAVAADPALGTERTTRVLRWRSDNEDATAPRERSGFARWLLELLGWFAGSARLLVWVAVALLAALVAVYLARQLAQRRADRLPSAVAAPTHVQDLDIRPDSLPDDIGAEAQRLWDAGQARGALALLYRGLLSRLAHEHQAPVRESTTEGGSIALARRFLPLGGGEFAAGLVNVWVHAVYGEHMPDSATVHALCAGFDGALRAPAADATGADTPIGGAA